MQETQVWSLGGEDLLEEEMATQSSILAWRIPWTEESGGPQSRGLQKSQTWLSNFSFHTFTCKRWSPPFISHSHPAMFYVSLQCIWPFTVKALRAIGHWDPVERDWVSIPLLTYIAEQDTYVFSLNFFFSQIGIRGKTEYVLPTSYGIKW